VSLIGFYAFQAGRPERGSALGTTNDLVGSLGAAFMIPAAVALGDRLPRRPAVRATRAAGLSAMVVLTATGPLLVFDVLPFRVSTPISLAAFLVLAGWLLGVNRASRRSAVLARGVTRLGQLCGAGTLAGAALVGSAFLLPRRSWPQVGMVGVGGVLGVGAMLAIPVWFLLLGRQLSRVPGHGAAVGVPNGSRRALR